MTLLMLAIGVILVIVLPRAAVIQLIATGTVLGIALCAMTVTLYLGVRQKRFCSAGFELGR